MEKINICLIMTGGLIRSGIAISMLQYVKSIDKDKFNIDVIDFDNLKNSIRKDYINAGANIIIMPNRRQQTLKYARHLNKIFKQNKYDVVHIHGSSSTLLIEILTAKHNKIKLKILHSHNTTCNWPKLEPIFNSSLNRHADVRLACGEEAGEWLFKDNPYLVFYNATNLNKYKFDSNVRNKMRKKYNLDNKIVIGHVGLFNNQKNHIFLIKVFFELCSDNDDYRLVLVGDGNLKPDIEQTAKKLGIYDKIIFTGSVSNVYEIINAFDVAVMPSLFEGLPVVSIEYQCNGIPCVFSNAITTECCATDDVVFLPLENNPRFWADLIKKIDLKDEKTRFLDSLRNIKKLDAKGFEITNSVSKLERIYSKSAE